jgi:hypothetical protein
MSYGVLRLWTSCLALFVITNVMLPGCRGAGSVHSRPEGATQVARVGREFKIKVGQQVTFRREGLRIRFAAVENDSRCPAGLTCVWAGDAEVLLEVSMRGGGRKRLKLHTTRSRQDAEEGKYRRYRIKLMELGPYPRSDQKITAGEYTATLLVSKE